jgi:site-specific DNA recombinase
MNKNGAIIYCRVSTKEQADNFSLKTQDEMCRAYCEREGLVVMAAFSEAQSGRSVDNRAQFQAMQEYCLKHYKEVAAVVVYNVSRFSRRTSDHLVAGLLLKKLGIGLRSVTEPIDSTPTGRFTETIMSAVAQLDNEQRASRTKDGMMRAVNEGKFVHRAPIGYVNASVPGGLAKDTRRADLIRQAFELFASGEKSNADILRIITDLGLRSPTNDSELSAQSFDNILRNPVYAGVISIPTWGLEVPGKFEPIIDTALHTRVRARLDGPLVPRQQSGVGEYFPLKVFVRCSACGQGLAGSFSTGRHGGKHGYYACRVRGCGSVRFKRLDLDVKFLELLDTLRLSGEFLPLLREGIRAVWRQKKTQRDDQLGQARKRVGELQAYREKIVKAWISEKITKEIYDDQMEKVGTDLEAAGLLEGEAVLELADIELLLDFADWMLANAASVWAGASFENKLRIQRSLFANGLPVSKEGFGTPEPISLFRQLQATGEDETSMASPGGFEPPLPP